MPDRDAFDALGGGCELRPAASFCGGAGGPSGAGAESARGPPRGPNGSSTASSLVACPAYCFLRVPRAAGERGAADTLGAEDASALEFDGESVLRQLFVALHVTCCHTRLILLCYLGSLRGRRARRHICALC